MKILKAEIIESIFKTANSIENHVEYPTCPGVYAFILKEDSELKEFGKSNDVIYVGIAKESLKKRDLANHFNSKSTGSSTLRRSIGAILKKDLGLIAYSRNGSDSKNATTNYKFDENGEDKLSEWMKDNLLIGYWEGNMGIDYNDLRKLEELVLIELKPSLDLDSRTKRYNSFASQLQRLREICRIEARISVSK